MFDFKTQTFEGTLLELFVASNGHMRALRPRFAAQHAWLLGEYERTPNLLPIRKGLGDTLRGSIVTEGKRRFLVADNEPLASIYKTLLDEGAFSRSLGELLERGSVSASWKCDLPGARGLSFKGVSSDFRKNGLKLAHIFDATKGLDILTDRESQLRMRFLRSLSALNVFLFPSPRLCEWTLLEGREPLSRDLGEDEFVRSAALGFVMSTLGLPESTWNMFRVHAGTVDVEVPADWERQAKAMRLRVSPRSAGARTSSTPRFAGRPSTSPRGLGASSVSSIKNTAASALDIEDAVVVLRAWLEKNPEASRIDGTQETKSNAARWFHMRVPSLAGKAVFTSRYGPVFDGSDYGGIVNFHGDTPVSALWDFVNAMADAESFDDVLIPSATYETMTKPENRRTIKPKFALKAYQAGVQGFFLYHDEHPGQTVG